MAGDAQLALLAQAECEAARQPRVFVRVAFSLPRLETTERLVPARVACSSSSV